MPARHGSFFRCLAPVFALGALMAGPALAADPTAEEQYWMELVNHARMDPAGELERLVNFSAPGVFGTPKSDNTDVINALNFFNVSASALASQWATLTAAPAVAWNGSLGDSSQAYSALMVAMDQQSHTLDGYTELELNLRVEDSGYTADYLDVGENLYASSKSVAYGHAAFLIDWGDDDGNAGNGFGTGIQNPAGHRIITFDPSFKEIGIGIVTSIPGTNTTAIGPLVATQHFASHYRQIGATFVSDAILTGVVYSDTLLSDDFYTPGEGMAGNLIEVYDNVTNALLYSGLTNSAGGFNIEMQGAVTGDVLRISAPGTGLADQLVTLTGHTVDASVYGAPVTFYDNPYARFQLVPEPGSLLLLAAGFCGLSSRRRKQAFLPFSPPSTHPASQPFMTSPVNL